MNANRQDRIERSRYRSPLRDAQATQTRTRVLDASEALFIDPGYLRTTMKRIAATAEVSVETVYAQGSKQSLLLACVDRALRGGDISVPVLESKPVAAALGRTSAPEVLREFAAATVAIGARAGGLLVAFEDAAASDAATLDLWTALEQRRRQDVHALVERVIELAPLREGLDLERAVEGLVLTLTPRWANRLFASGWTQEEVTDWGFAAMAVLLLGPGLSSAHAGQST